MPTPYTYQQLQENIQTAFPDTHQKFPDLLYFVTDESLRQRFRFTHLITDFISAVIADRNWDKKQLHDNFPEVLDEYRVQCVIFPVDKEPEDAKIYVYTSDTMDAEFKYSMVFSNMDEFTAADLSELEKAKQAPPKLIMVMSNELIPFLFERKQEEE